MFLKGLSVRLLMEWLVCVKMTSEALSLCVCEQDGKGE